MILHSHLWAFLPVLGGAILQTLLNYIHHYLSWWQISWHGVWNRWSFFCSELLKVSRTLFSLHSSLPSQQSQIPSFTLLLKIQVGEDLQKKIIFMYSLHTSCEDPLKEKKISEQTTGQALFWTYFCIRICVETNHLATSKHGLVYITI